MSRKFVVRSDSYGECVYLRMFGRGRYGSKFGLVRSPAEATAFSSRVEAGTKAGRAGNVIMREFNTVELDATPAATTQPHIGVRSIVAKPNTRNLGLASGADVPLSNS
jgi:hypothetical protein